MHYLLFYEVGDDYVTRRAQYRNAHLEKAWQASARGELVLGGALSNPVDGAVLLFKGDSPEVAERFARADPYVTSGAVKRWHVREWNTVVGEDSSTPIRPNGVADVSTKDMILRMWSGRATPEKSGQYIDHATKKVLPALAAIQGHRGAYLSDAQSTAQLNLSCSLFGTRWKPSANSPEQSLRRPWWNPKQGLS